MLFWNKEFSRVILPPVTENEKPLDTELATLLGEFEAKGDRVRIYYDDLGPNQTKRFAWISLLHDDHWCDLDAAKRVVGLHFPNEYRRLFGW